MADRPIRWIVDDAGKFTAREVRRGRRYDGILLDPPKFGRGPEGEVWRLEEHLAPLLADCRKLLDDNSRFLVLTVYAVRMSALAIGELVRQVTADLGGDGRGRRNGVREEARGLLLPTAIFARWSLGPRQPRIAAPVTNGAPATISKAIGRFQLERALAVRRPPPPRRRSAAARPAAAAAGRPSAPARGRPAVSAATATASAARAGVPIASAISGATQRLALQPEQEAARHAPRAAAAARRSASGRRSWPRRPLPRLVPASASWSSTPSARSGSTSRSIGSSAAVSAAIHKPPPPIRASSRASGPTANGTRVATSRKKTTGSQAAPAKRAAHVAGDERADHRPSSSCAPVAAERLVAAASTAPPLARCAAMSASEPLGAVARRGRSAARRAATRARADGDRPAPAARACAWPVDSRRTGTVRQARQAHGVHRLVERRRRRSRRPGRGRSGSSRSSARCSSASASSAALDPARRRPQQPGGEADQARLAAAVGAGEVQRLAGAERRGRAPSNSSRPPRTQATPSNRSSGAHACVLERVHVLVAEAEMMADLVHQRCGATRCSSVSRRRAHSSRIGRRNRRMRSGSVPE